LDLLTCKGNWYAAVRLGYQIAIARDVSASFGGQPPNRSASDTAPSSMALENWSAIFENCFLKFTKVYPDVEWKGDQPRRQELQESIHEQLNMDSRLNMNSEADLRQMIDEVIQSFLYNSSAQACR
jgi:hypothetical protein